MLKHREAPLVEPMNETTIAQAESVGYSLLLNPAGISAGYTCVDDEVVSNFLLRYPAVASQLARARPLVEHMFGIGVPTMLMVLSDQECEPSLFARILVRCSVDEALDLSDRFDEVFRQEVGPPHHQLTFDVGTR